MRGTARRSGTGLAAILAAASLLALAPGSASASQAGASDTDITFTALAGETNDVTIGPAPGGLTITDPGAPIAPQAGCAAVNANQVTCSAPRLEGLTVTLNDLNDKVVVGQQVAGVIFLGVSGGDGADQITVSARVEESSLAGDAFFLPGPGDGADVIAGGPGREFINPGGGNDVVRAGGGPDSAAGTEADGADSFQGGGGIDFYFSETDFSMRIDLDGVADDGAGCPGPGCEGDNIMADVEGVGTGDGTDVLVGNGGSNSLFPGGGNDTVVGGGGPDDVGGNDGNDDVRGGAGPDLVSGDDGVDRLDGGAGDDSLFSSGFQVDRDVVIGGKGNDLADFSDATAGVKVDFDGRPDDGVAGENDNVRADVEDILGSRYRDVLVGSPRDNDFQGGDGADKLTGGKGLDGLIGGNGADNIAGGGGRDLLDGGGGADRITSRRGGPDEVLCGAAFDRVKADRRDRTAADCDRVRRA